jgi:hypothetical protein
MHAGVLPPCDAIAAMKLAALRLPTHLNSRCWQGVGGALAVTVHVALQVCGEVLKHLGSR